MVSGHLMSPPSNLCRAPPLGWSGWHADRSSQWSSLRCCLWISLGTWILRLGLAKKWHRRSVNFLHRIWKQWKSWKHGNLELIFRMIRSFSSCIWIKMLHCLKHLYYNYKTNQPICGSLFHVICFCMFLPHKPGLPVAMRSSLDQLRDDIDTLDDFRKGLDQRPDDPFRWFRWVEGRWFRMDSKERKLAASPSEILLVMILNDVKLYFMIFNDIDDVDDMWDIKWN